MRIILLLLFALPASASGEYGDKIVVYHPSWLCREESSQRMGSTIQACGVGRGSDLTSARAAALEAAIAEFKRVCETSADCRGYETVSRPLRTDCEAQAGGFQCFRGVEFVISYIRKTDIAVDPELLENEIETKRQHLDDLNRQLQLKRESQDLDARVNQAEVDLSAMTERRSEAGKPQPEYVVKTAHWGAEFGVGGAPIQSGGMTAFRFSGSYERAVVGRAGIRLGAGILTGSTGTADGSPTTQYGVSGVEVRAGIAVPLGPVELQSMGGYFAGTATTSSPTVFGGLVDAQNRTVTASAVGQTFTGGTAAYRFGPGRAWSVGAEFKAYGDSGSFAGSRSGGGFLGFRW